MAARTRADAPPKKPSANVPAVAEPTQDEWTAALQNAGLINPASAGNGINRLTVKGTNVVLGKDEIIAAYNQMTREPALYVQLMGRPAEEQALWFDKLENIGTDRSNALLAKAVGRDGSIPDVPSIVGRFCRSHFGVEGEDRRFSEDGTSCDTCPVHPRVPKDQLPDEAQGKGCTWRGEIQFRILDKQEDGTLAGTNSTIYTMGLATTGIIEFVGASKTPLAGAVSEFNTMTEIGKLGYTKWGKEGVLKARTMLDLGGVICEFHILPASSGAFNWNVPSFRPIEILEQTIHPAIAEAADEGFETGDVPF